MNITKLTEQYIREHPSIRDCLKSGLVNHSALARKIMADTGADRFDAVLAASRRYKAAIEDSNEEGILRILRKSKLEVKNRMMIAVLEKMPDFRKILEIEQEIKKAKGLLNIIEGSSTVTLVTNSEFRPVIERIKDRLISVTDDLVQINLVCPPEIETTPGVINHVYSFFAQSGINIVEEMSCWTDLMIIIAEDDLAKAMRFLKF